MRKQLRISPRKTSEAPPNLHLVSFQRCWTPDLHLSHIFEIAGGSEEHSIQEQLKIVILSCKAQFLQPPVLLLVSAPLQTVLHRPAQQKQSWSAQLSAPMRRSAQKTDGQIQDTRIIRRNQGVSIHDLKIQDVQEVFIAVQCPIRLFTSRTLVRSVHSHRSP